MKNKIPYVEDKNAHNNNNSNNNNINNIIIIMDDKTGQGAMSGWHYFSYGKRK